MKDSFKSPFWVLGKSISGITSMEWIGKNLESFANCGTIIVDPATLSNDVLANMTTARMNDIQNEILKRFQAGGDIICILQKRIDVQVNNTLRHNYFWSPIPFSIQPINRGRGIQRDATCNLSEYLDKIKYWHSKINPSINPKVYGELYNDNHEILGGLYSVSYPSESGKFLALPPQDDPSNSLSVLLESLNLFEKTPPPDWTQKIVIPKINELKKLTEPIDEKIHDLKEERQKFQDQIEKLEDHKKLLYCNGSELEESVKTTLEYLGLSNVQFGIHGKDDIVFDFTNTPFKLCSIEVKGRDKNGKLDDFRELDHWVTDHLAAGKKAKGVLIANTNRLEDITSSESKRMDFSHFEEYYKPRNYCVLPTITLFKLVNHILDGNKIEPKKIEQVLADANHVLTIDDFT